MSDLTPAPSFIIQHGDGSAAWFLRGTAWANRDRASRFETKEAAQAALDKARKFMRPGIYRAASIVAA